jgi:glucan phosphoethanolaminetransferase (alkaline phosphatase superfamily)
LFKKYARGFLAAILVLVVFEATNDFLLTFASDLVDNDEFPFAFRATIVAFITTFIAAYVARERVHWAVAALIVMYWIAISVYRYSSAVGATEIGYVAFVANGLRTIVPSLVFGWLGAFLGWQYWSSDKGVAKRRNVVVAAIALLVLVVSPTLYSWYWETRAIEQVRIAVRAIHSGEVPENVRPFKNILVDSTQVVESLMERWTPETEIAVHHKSGVGFHSYTIDILPGEEETFGAIASYYERDGWSISCCWRVEQ